MLIYLVMKEYVQMSLYFVEEVYLKKSAPKFVNFILCDNRDSCKHRIKIEHKYTFSYWEWFGVFLLAKTEGQFSVLKWPDR